MTQNELKEVLANHKKWLECEDGKKADLRGADLRGADLREANLSEAKGLLLLPVQDARGYSFAHAIECVDGWRIRAGCRYFTISKAREHWGPGYKGDREQGDMYLYAIEWLEQKLAAGNE